MPLLADEKYPTTVAGARHLIEAYEKMFAVVDSKLRACVPPAAPIGAQKQSDEKKKERKKERKRKKTANF